MGRRVIELDGGMVRRDDRYGRFEPGIDVSGSWPVVGVRTDG
jgi:hypothetical protein